MPTEVKTCWITRTSARNWSGFCVRNDKLSACTQSLKLLQFYFNNFTLPMTAFTAISLIIKTVFLLIITISYIVIRFIFFSVVSFHINGKWIVARRKCGFNEWFKWFSIGILIDVRHFFSFIFCLMKCKIFVSILFNFVRVLILCFPCYTNLSIFIYKYLSI